MWEITAELQFEQGNKHFIKMPRSSTRPGTRSCTRVRATSNINKMLGEEGIESIPVGNNLDFGGLNTGHEPKACTPSLEGKLHPWLHLKRNLSLDSPTGCCIQLRSFQYKTDMDLFEQVQMRSMKMIRELDTSPTKAG